MNPLPPLEPERRVRIRTRVSGRKKGGELPGVSRKKTLAILLLAAAVGILIGVMLGRGMRKIIRVRRDQEQIAQSRSPAAAGRARAEAPVPGPGPVDSPGR